MMTPTNETKSNLLTKPVTRTVFDLMSFDNVRLTKVMTLPAKPTSVQEALEAVGNDPAKLLDVIYSGLVTDATNREYEDITGFLVIDDETGKPGEPYTGKFADEEISDKINAAVLALAKIQGYDKSLPKEKKTELKETARNFLRSNPAMLASIQK